MRLFRAEFSPVVLLLLFCSGGFAQTVNVTLVGMRTIATGTMVGGAEVGGLSGISYDEQSDRFRANSDDSRSAGAGRVWTLDLSYDGAAFTAATALSSQQLRAANGTTLPTVGVVMDTLRLAIGSSALVTAPAASSMPAPQVLVVQ